MNFYFNTPRKRSPAPIPAWAFILFFILGFPSRALALNVVAIYRTACDRVLGVIVGVDKRDIQLLDISGKLERIPRHQIVSMAYYPVSRFPVETIAISEGPRAIRISTLVKEQVQPLVVGWPVDFSEQKIAFLQSDGRELVIDRDSLWALSYVESVPSVTPLLKPITDDFVHPQAVGFCSATEKRAGGVHPVYPQQFLNDEVVMKRELDRLQEGFGQVAHYEGDQKFYPVPQLYRNRTSLGIWFPLGSRHGTSSRRGRFAPLVIDELSMGPFRFQHLFLTGVTPNPALLHEEPQTQIYYRFKAAYFHASVMIDPETILVGEKYKWRGRDLDIASDVRISEMFALDLGFDLGPVSLQLYPVVAGNVAMRVGKQFYGHIPNLWRLGPRLTFRRIEGELVAGYASDFGVKHTYGRFNLAGWPHRRLFVSGSFIYRKTEAQPYFVEFAEPVANAVPSYPMNIQDTQFPRRLVFTTWVGALQVLIPVGHRFTISLATSLERLHVTYGVTEPVSSQRIFPKASGFLSFTF